MPLYFVAITSAVVFAGLSGVPLSYDGSYVLFRLLEDHAPYTPHGRFIHLMLQWPVILASNYTSDLAILRPIFGLMYASIPLLALLTSWALVRNWRPGLFVWPSLAIGVAELPGQLVFISEGVMASQLGWPVLLGTESPRQASTACDNSPDGSCVRGSPVEVIARVVEIPFHDVR